MGAAIAIAAATVLEARRNRLVWLLAAAALAAVGAGMFAGAMALTETREMRAAIAGPILRFSSVFIVAGFVTTSMAREADDRVREVLLALPVTRTRYLLARLTGFCAVAGAVALLCGAAVLPFAAPAQVALWTFSLACELSIVAAFALFAATGLSSVVAALGATLAFYLLARLAAALQALGRDQSAGNFESLVADAVSALMPHLDAFARTEWLAYGTGTAANGGQALVQAGIYVVLLAAACALDLQRKEIA